MKLKDYPFIKYELLKSTELAALKSFSMIGRGDQKAADKEAVVAMRRFFNECNIKGRIVIGEGERDKAPMLFIGEEVGIGKGPEIDIAVDPLEGTEILACGMQNALSVAAFANKNSILHAPDTYMDKIAIGFDFEEQIIDVDNNLKENVKNISAALKKNKSDLTAIVLNRSRHQELIAKLREEDVRVFLIGDGDVSAVMSTTQDSGADFYIGIGGAPEGVLAAAALKTLGGQISTRLIIDSDEEKNRAKKIGISDFSKKYYLNDLIKEEAIFIASGVSDGHFLDGVKFDGENAIIDSMILDSAQKNITFINNSFKIYNNE